jgi:hypothetical protein
MIRKALREILMRDDAAVKEKLEAAKMLQGLLIKDGRSKNDGRKNLGKHAMRREPSAPPANDLLGASK